MLVFSALTVIAVGACGSDAQALPMIPESGVPDTKVTVGEKDIVTKAQDGCLQSGGQTLVFVDGQAELVEVDSNERLQVRSVGDDGTGGLASIPLEGAEATPLGYPVEPDDWAEQPADGCNGPYFLVVGFEPPND